MKNFKFRPGTGFKNWPLPKARPGPAADGLGGLGPLGKIGHSQPGQALLLTIVFLLSASLALLFSFSSLALSAETGVRRETRSRQSYFLAEAGLEDAAYRITRGLPYAASQTVPLGNAGAEVEISGTNQKEIIATGNALNAIRKLKAVLKTGIGTSFSYGVQVDSGGISMANGSSVQGSVYSNGSIIGNNTAQITGDAIVAGGIADEPTLAWSVDNANQEFATNGSDRDIAQSFTATVSDRLNKVSVYLAKIGEPTQDLTLRIAQDDAGEPATSDMAREMISRTLVGSSPSWVDVSFAAPPMLASGQKYWIILDYGTDSVQHHWNWRKDPSDGYASNTGRTAPDWSKSSSIWSDAGGDLLFRAWIGGTSTRIENITVGDGASGTARANLFVNMNVHGSACPNPYCITDNPPREELPIPQGIIEDWKQEALTLGGECGPPACDASGNYFLGNGETETLGPVKVPGTFRIDNNATFMVNGTIWVAGDAVFDNNCNATLDASYGPNSGMIIVDGTVTVSNNCKFAGSGSPGSYILLISNRNAPGEEVFTVDNGSTGVIYYAGRGRIKVKNNALARQVTAYGITLDNNAAIVYESGLANANFTAGPQGGWEILSWNETK